MMAVLKTPFRFEAGEQGSAYEALVFFTKNNNLK